ncbi:MAG TPA: DUF3662 and FHA domain-containing protein [Thermomicrobiales bacterium]|nr:DUF3662 and FHA domain-containing protein [Thermomicrobiales bacterium]
MNPLDKLEQSIERLFEGTAGALFRQSLKPAELGKRLEQAMRDGRQVSVGKTIVPNKFTVHLHPDDYAPFAKWEAGLCQEMESYLLHSARERDLSFIYKPSVSLVADEHAKRRLPRIESSIVETNPPVQRPMTRPVTPRPQPPTPTYADTTPIRSFAAPAATAPPREIVFRCIAGDDIGLELTFPQGESSIGRSSDRDAVLRSMHASRNHARLRVVGARAFIADAGSTHGTYVNGARISGETALSPGDTVKMGNHEFTVSPGDDGWGRR